MENNNLNICQDCKVNPAVYGDGLTWARCSACQLKNKSQKMHKEPEQQEPVLGVNGFEHKIVPGLTSIILPVYMVNYSLFHYTGNCIGSVREHTAREKYELVVIDNGSPIQPPDLNSYYADKVIKNEANLGVTHAWNQGIRMSTGEYIVLLNNDVQVFEGWLEEMQKGLEQYDFVMAHPMYSLTEPFARAVESKAVRTGTKKFDAIGKDFSCVMFKRSLLEELGTFDERFFVYYSDSDFFKRMDEAGKKYAVLDNVATSHISDATGYAIPETPEIMNKDKAVFEEKWAKKAVEVTVDQVVQGEGFKIDAKHFERAIVRTPDTGDSVYLIHNGKYHHIADPDTLHALGFAFGEETTIENFSGLERGEVINMSNYHNYEENISA